MTALPGARPRERGFTLIELMIVIVLLAILAGIAVPSYRNYVLRANRADATALLLKVRSAQEKFFLQNDRYATNDDLDDPPPGGLGYTNRLSENGFYQVRSDPDPTAPVGQPSFMITATAVGRQVDDAACQTFTVTDRGARGSSPGPATTCWK